MGRRSAPKGRFSLRRGMRFEPLEAVIAVAAFVVFAGGLLVSLSEIRAIADLTEHGRCVDAQVVTSGSSNSLRLGRSAGITYAVGGVRYDVAIHYDSDQPLPPHSALEICTAEADPATFAVDDRDVSGSSTALWLRGVVGDPVSAVGLVVFGLVVGKHQWRFLEDDPPST